MVSLLKKLKSIKKYAIASAIFVVLSHASALILPMLMSEIINTGIANEDMGYIQKIGALMLVISALGILISVFSSYYTSKTSALYGKLLRRDLFLKVESLAQRDIDKIGTPSLITRTTNDVRVMQDFILTALRIIISVPVMLVGGMVMAFVLNPKLAVIIFSVFPIIGVILAIVLKFVIPLFKRRQKLVDSVNRFVREKLSGIRVIKAFNRLEFEDEKFEEKNNDLSSLTLKFQRFMSVLIPVCMIIIIIAVDLFLLAATKNLDSLDHIADKAKLLTAVGDLQAFVLYMIMIIASVTMAAAMFVIIPRAKISAGRIGEVFDLQSEIQNPETALTPDESKKGTVEFKNVSFSYENGTSVLSDVSFTAEKNKVTAIIGGTGSGKSTIVNLIPRFYDVTEGELLFDGVNVKALDQDDLHSRIAFIPQKAFLFSGTIEENLRYGDENATEERLRFALDISQSSEFVDKLPEGIHSFVSQSGTNLSGGQKQRLSIARALVRQAEVYLFDDSFSALDFKTDALLRKAIKENIEATVIIVAQRIGTIIDADKIIVLDEGKVVAEGRHEELLKTSEVYREIYTSQISEEVTQ